MSGVFAAALAALGWGTDSVLARQGLRQLPVALGTFLSLCAGLSGCLVVFFLLDPGGLGRYPLSAFAWFGAVGLLNFLVGRQCNYHATQRLGAARSAAIFATSPLVSIVLAVGITGERVDPLLLVGVALIIGGVVLVVRS